MPDEKVNEIRLYNGTKYQVVPSAQAGEIAAISGLKTTHPGQGLRLWKRSNELYNAASSNLCSSDCTG